MGSNHPSHELRYRAGPIARFILLLVGAAIAADGMVGERGLIAVLRARHGYQELTTRIEHLKAQNNALRDAARRLREDPATIESVARQELGLIRPGETVFIIRNVAAAPRAPELPPAR